MIAAGPCGVLGEDACDNDRGKKQQRTEMERTFL
jgi:hypothetical protein